MMLSSYEDPTAIPPTLLPLGCGYRTSFPEMGLFSAECTGRQAGWSLPCLHFPLLVLSTEAVLALQLRRTH